LFERSGNFNSSPLCRILSTRGGKLSIQVLLIEDNATDATLIKEILSDAREDIKVTTVSRLSEARDIVFRHYINVILLDLGLPDSQGLDTLTQALAFSEGVPIIVLTGNTDEALGTEAARMGAQDYLVKGEVTVDNVQRSILYAIERKKAQDAIKDALQSYADLVRELPSALLTFQYEWPGRLCLLSWNTRAEDMLHPPLWVGMDLESIWPLEEMVKEIFLDVALSGDPFTVKGERFERDEGEMAIDLRAFRIPCHRVCVSIDDVTDRVMEEELRKKAYQQIDLNIEHFASLVDEIRNPNSVIIGVAEQLDGKTSRCILTQAERIESIINRLDEQWVASENVRQFLRRTLPIPPLE
jgi:CheY-like chemotaxis protein